MTATAAPTKMMYFRLLRGRHVEGRGDRYDPERKIRVPIRDPLTGTLGKTYMALDRHGNPRSGEGMGFQRGDEIVESSVDLVKKYGRDKFQQLLGRDLELVLGDLDERKAAGARTDDLDKMTVGQLREFAATENITVDTGLKKEELIEAIRLELQTR